MSKQKQTVYVLEATNPDNGQMEVEGVYYDLETVFNNVAGGNRIIIAGDFEIKWRISADPLIYTTTFKVADGYCDMRITEHKIYSYP